MRSYIGVRVEPGKPEVRTNFPEDQSSYVDAIQWCESDGYTVIGHRIVETPYDKKFVAMIYVYVRPQAGSSPNC